MGIVLELRRVTPDEAAALASDPSDVAWFLLGEPSEPRASGCLLPWLRPSGGARDAERRVWVPPPANRVADLDKAWHAIHFLLAGESEGGPIPAAYLSHGGRQLGDVHVGYDPARLLAPAEVEEFADYLATVTEEELRRNYDPAALKAADIYPNIWDLDDDEIDYVLENFRTLRDFMRAASDAGDGVVLYHV